MNGQILRWLARALLALSVKTVFSLCGYVRWRTRFSSVSLCITLNTFWSCSSGSRQSSEESSLSLSSALHCRRHLHSQRATKLLTWKIRPVKMICTRSCFSSSCFCWRSDPITHSWHCDYDDVAFILCCLPMFSTVTFEISHMLHVNT